MNRFFVHLSYNGARHHGWQIQKDRLNVQGHVEKIVSEVLKEKIRVFGCGRTDSYVHASQFVLHFNTEQSDWSYDLVERLNRRLADDVVIWDIWQGELSQHARYHAHTREYQYFIHTKRTLNIQDVSSLMKLDEINVDLINQALEVLLQTDDFLAFCKTPDNHDSTICDLRRLDLYVNRYKDQICIHFESNRFLRGMIRNLMTRILEVANGVTSLEELGKIVRKEGTLQLPVPAPPQGLHLTRVIYPFWNALPNIDPMMTVLHRKDDVWELMKR